LLNGDCLGDDILHGLLAWAVVQVGEEQAGEIGVHTLIARYQLVGESETRHETTLLEPEDRCEGTTEEDTLDSSKSHKSLGECGALVRDPFEGPIGFLANARYCDASIMLMRSRVVIAYSCLLRQKDMCVASAL